MIYSVLIIDKNNTENANNIKDNQFWNNNEMRNRVKI